MSTGSTPTEGATLDRTSVRLTHAKINAADRTARSARPRKARSIASSASSHRGRSHRGATHPTPRDRRQVPGAPHADLGGRYPDQARGAMRAKARACASTPSRFTTCSAGAMPTRCLRASAKSPVGPGVDRHCMAILPTLRTRPMKIRLAENFRAVFYAPFYATQALGLYAREDLEVEFVASANPGNAVPGLLDGAIDITWRGPDAGHAGARQGPGLAADLLSRGGGARPIESGRSARSHGVPPHRSAELHFATVAEVPTPDVPAASSAAREALFDPKPSHASPIAPWRTTSRRCATASSTWCRCSNPTSPPRYATTSARSSMRRARAAPASTQASRVAHADRGAATDVRGDARGGADAGLAGKNGDEKLAEVTAPYYPGRAARRAARGAKSRYRRAGIWAATPAMSRDGFVRLAESFLSGGLLKRPPSFEACVEESL